MRSNLKILALAVTAALALSGVLASTASAWFTWEGEGDPPTATGSAAGFQVFHSTKEELVCEGVTFDSGTVFGGMITATPTYSNCIVSTALGAFQAHVEPKGCDIELHTDWAMSLVCPKDTEMQVSVTFLGMKFPCLTFPSQLHGSAENRTVTYTNEGSGASADILVAVAVEGMEYTRDGPCGSGTATNGGYFGAITVKGDDPTSKKQIGISWDDH